jgi:hypothetical protein
VSAIPENAASGRKPRFLDQMRTFMRARRYTRRTEQAYVDWVRRFILFHSKRHPRELGENEIVGFSVIWPRSGKSLLQRKIKRSAHCCFYINNFWKENWDVSMALCGRASR